MAMMDCMNEHPWCPECKPVFNRQNRRVGQVLTCVESNYHGCGVDMANCEKCGKGFQISFKIDKIERAPEWDEIKGETSNAN